MAGLPRLKQLTPSSLPVARGFYQVEERHLSLILAAADRRHFSSLEAECCLLTCNRSGELIGLQLTLPRESWRFSSEVASFTQTPAASIRFLDFRTTIAKPEVVSNADRSIVRLIWSAESDLQWSKVADTVLIATADQGRLAALQFESIVDDLAGQAQAAFLQEQRGASEE